MLESRRCVSGSPCFERAQWSHFQRSTVQQNPDACRRPCHIWDSHSYAPHRKYLVRTRTDRVWFVMDKVALTNVFPRILHPPGQYHSTNAPHSYSFTWPCYQKDEREKPGNLETKKCCFENLGAVGGSVQSYFFLRLTCYTFFSFSAFVTDHQLEGNGVTFLDFKLSPCSICNMFSFG